MFLQYSRNPHSTFCLTNIWEYLNHQIRVQCQVVWLFHWTGTFDINVLHCYTLVCYTVVFRLKIKWQNFLSINTIKMQSNYIDFCAILLLLLLEFGHWYFISLASIAHTILISRQEPYIKTDQYIDLLVSIIFPKNMFAFVLWQNILIPLQCEQWCITANLKFVSCWMFWWVTDSRWRC